MGCVSHAKQENVLHRSLRLNNMHAPDLYELASQAALDPGRWSEVLSAACEATGAMGGAMFTPGVDAQGPHLGAITNGYGDISGYKVHRAEYDPWLRAVEGRHFFETAGEVRLGSEFLSDAEVRRTAYYNDFGRFSGGGAGHKIALKVCDARDGFAPVTHFIVGKPFSSGPFDETAGKRMAQFWRPVRQAVRLHWKLARHLADQASPAGALEVVPVPTLILREDGFIEFASSAAQRLMKEGKLLRIGNGHLRRIGTLDAPALRSLICDAARTSQEAFAMAIDGERLRRVRLTFSPLRQSPRYAVAWPRAAVMLVLMEGYSSEFDEEAWYRCLAQHFKLTRSEESVLRGVAAGRSVEEIAAAKGVIPGTVRTHLAALFDKTGRRRQSELVRLAMGR